MTTSALIHARLEFPHVALRAVLDALLSLPGELRPTRHSVAEDDPIKSIGDIEKFCEVMAKKTDGFILYGVNATYDVSPVAKLPIICNGFDIKPPLAKEFLTHMAKAHPTFGYACAPDEEERRNRLKTKVGNDTVESWLGRKTERHIPGLYWLTLLSEALAAKHHVPLTAVEAIALDHVDLGSGQHLFRFYERPEAWHSNSAVEKLCASLPGFFDIEKVRSQVDTSKTYVEFSAALDKWR